MGRLATLLAPYKPLRVCASLAPCHPPQSTLARGAWVFQQTPRAEAFARFFGTPFFLVTQTLFVAIWIILNVVGITHFDLYPFILLNLAFSTQAAYAAPLILLAQTRQADRDKAHADADAQHREALALAAEERELLAAKQTTKLLELMRQNTDITEMIKVLSERIEILTGELHGQLCKAGK